MNKPDYSKMNFENLVKANNVLADQNFELREQFKKLHKMISDFLKLDKEVREAREKHERSKEDLEQLKRLHDCWLESAGGYILKEAFDDDNNNQG